MGQLVFQATAGGQVALVGPNPSSNFSLNVPAVNGNLVTTGDTGTVTNTMLASSAYTAPGTIGSGTPNSGAFTTLSASSTVSGTGFSTYLASPPAIGGTTPSTGKFTSITNTGLTSGYVVYATTSGLETGSANLKFDGSSLGVGGYVNISGFSNAISVNSTATNAAFELAYQGTVVGNLRTDSGTFELRSNGTDLTLNSNPSGTNNIIFKAGSNTERMRVTSGGKLDIGNTYGAGYGTYLAVGTAIPSNSAIAVFGTANTNVPAIGLTNFTGSTSTQRIVLNFDSSGYGGFSIGMPAAFNAFYVYDELASAERMRIDSSGNLLVGTTAAGSWNANCWGVQTGSGFTVHGHANGTGSGTAYIYFDYNNNPIGSITQSGTTNIAVNGTSDYRLKTINKEASCLDDLNKLKIYDFTWVDGRKDIGGLAHEIAEVYQDIVTGEKDAVDKDGKPIYQQVSYLSAVPRLIRAIQEQQALITTLQTQVAALQAKVGA